MNAIDCLKKRISVREYAEKEIPKEVLKEIVDCARFAPTARNTQPWEFIVVTEKETREKISDITGKNGSFIRDASACIAVFCQDTRYYLEDGCNATTYILLAAHSFGIGSCWVAGDKKDYCGDITKLLNVPEGYKLISLVSLGYPKEEPEAREKRQDVIHWGKF